MKTIALSKFGLMTVAEAAEFRQISTRTVQRWIEADAFKVVVLGAGRNKVYLLPIDDFNAYEPPRPGAPEGNQFAKKKRPRAK